MLSRLTKYEILGALASGGMADVWLARVGGPQGFDKLVVVKTIKQTLAVEPSFVEMFFNEARVAAMLNHPNCVQIFDVGDENGVSYIAMEFIDGFSLGRVLKRAELSRTVVPPTVIARICMDAAAGLEHAHTLVDRYGQAAGLVHRDVSPDNVLVGFNGQTKLVDFGIAKAAGPKAPRQSTRTGTLKGKFGYMAPEYLSGLQIDGRADQFALGVVMYRAFTGAKPFSGVTEALVANAVLNHVPIAPRTINPTLAGAVEDVVMKALSKDPLQRFDSAKALRKALERAVGQPADIDEVAQVMEALWPQADDERGRVRALASGETKEQSGPVLDSVGSASVEVNMTLQTSSQPPHGATQASQTYPGPRRNSIGALIIAAVALLVCGAGAAYFVFQPKPGAPAPVRPPIAISPATPTVPTTPTPGTQAAHDDAAHDVPPPVADGPGRVEVTAALPMDISWNGKAMGRTPATFELPSGAQTLKLTNKELGTRALQVTVVAGELVKAHAAIGKGSIEVRVSPWATVKIDGRAIGDTPLPPQDLLEGRHTIELSNAKLGKSKKLTVQLLAGEKKLVRETMD